MAESPLPQHICSTQGYTTEPAFCELPFGWDIQEDLRESVHAFIPYSVPVEATQ